MQLVRETGDWEEWLQFFLKGVVETANQAVSTAQAILNLFKEDRKQIESAGKLAPSLMLVHYYLQKYPTTDGKKVMKNCKISLPTANSALNYLLKIE